MSIDPQIPPLSSPSTGRHVPLTVERRGGTVESVHYGSVAVADRDGRVLFSAGDPQFLTFTRSTLKPVQAVPFIAEGGAERYGYSQSQVALMCASHSGEPAQVEAVADMLRRSGNKVDDLQCGTHAPGFYEARGEIPPPPPYSPLAHNCSGKHCGMLAWCAIHAASKESYLEFDHPLQQVIRRSVAHFAAIPEVQLASGIDGCSAPNYAIPLAALARVYARLVDPSPDPIYGTAPRRLADAMISHPEMVSGERRNDLALMQAGRDDWVAKVGAEGVQAIGVRSLGIGIAIKVADGAKRGLHPATVSVLEQLGLLDGVRRGMLAAWAGATVRNSRGVVTGEVHPVLVLDKHCVRHNVGITRQNLQ